MVLLYGQRSEQANREHRNPVGKHAFFTCYIFFYIFTSENMENTSVLVYKTPISSYLLKLKYPSYDTIFLHD